MLLAFLSFDTVEKRIRSFNAENLESVGQRAAKLSALQMIQPRANLNLGGLV